MPDSPSPDLDPIDRRLLEALQRNARVKIEVLADDVGLSASAVQRRVARLRQTGVIVGEHVVVDPKAVGRPLLVIMELVLERESTAATAGLRTWLMRADEVQSAWTVTGEGDFVLIVTVPDMEAYDLFARRMLDENEVIREFRTSVALNKLKHSLFVPVER